MKVGVLKEIKEDEKRVALLPDQVDTLVQQGHDVYVEQQAGADSGFQDTEYEEKGATVVSKRELLDCAQLLLKVKAPLREEYGDYRSDHTLFSFLHFDENIKPQEIKALIDSGVLGIAYESVGVGMDHPILQPTSRLAGYLFAQKACQLCAQYKGVFCGGNEEFLPSADALIIGLGNIGLSTLRYFLDNRVRLTVIDNAAPRMANMKVNVRFGTEDIDYIGAYKIDFTQMDVRDPLKTKSMIAERMPKLDIVICAAVRRQNLPKDKIEYLIDREMISQMSPGSVLCDATANDRDLVETCISSASLHSTYEVGGVVHYNCDHIPTLVAKTASQLLTQESFPYVLQMANRGVIETIRSNRSLRNGVSCFKGQMTHRYSAEKKGLCWKPIEDLCNHG